MAPAPVLADPGAARGIAAGPRGRLVARVDPWRTVDSPTSPAERAHLSDLVTAAASRTPDHPAVVDVSGPTVLSWSELDRAAAAEAARLREHGVGTGDRVAVRLTAGAAYCVALLGALRAGAIAVPLGPRASRRELDLVLLDCRPTVLVAAADDATADDAVAASGTTRLGPPDPGARAEPTDPPGGGEDIALLIYTSGSTGVPRGVCLSHRALLANREQSAALRPAPITPVDRVLLAMPLFHSYGLGAGLLQVCWSGATLVLSERLDAERLAEVIVEQRVSTLAGVPATFRALLELPAERLRAATAGMRLCTCGGAPLPPRYLADFRASTGLAVVEGYGLTEAGPVVTSNPLDGVPKPGSVGRPLPGVEVRLVDPAGGVDPAPRANPAARELPDPTGELVEEAADDFDDDFDTADGTGLVAVRGPNLFSGYWPDRAGGPDADGWFRTVDVGFLDADGDLHLVDRLPDLVIVNGFSVYPHEVERVLAELPGLVEAAVVGMPDERTGEGVRAVLVRAPGAELSEDDVRAHCEKRLARFKVPAVIEFVDVLPRTATGKIARRLLVAEVAGRAGSEP
jgi:long-chain acyl-CoA synthetase